METQLIIQLAAISANRVFCRATVMFHRMRSRWGGRHSWCYLTYDDLARRHELMLRSPASGRCWLLAVQSLLLDTTFCLSVRSCRSSFSDIQFVDVQFCSAFTLHPSEAWRCVPFTIPFIILHATVESMRYIEWQWRRQVLSMLSTLPRCGWVYIVQCKRDKITGVLPRLLTAALGTTK